MNNKKKVFISEKPSVAAEFAKVLGVTGGKGAGYIESDKYIITWCVGHLVTMSYPEKYDEKYKRWSLDTLPFIPDKFLYEIIDSVKKQFEVVKAQLNRDDVDTIYICTDSGREGEYIYRLVDSMAGVSGKQRKRVWIDSQTEDEIKRGIAEAKDWSEYDNISNSAYLRAKEDYLMGINFSRLLTLKYGNTISAFLNTKHTVISVGRVMTCVLGMVVKREREIRAFDKTPFYRIIASLKKNEFEFEAEWKAVEGSEYFESPKLYKENGFKKKECALGLIEKLKSASEATVVKVDKKKETKNPPLLYNLAELQADCSKRFKISPDETLATVQQLYERKLVTYPRTDARVLSTAVAKEIDKNIKGLTSLKTVGEYAKEVLEKGLYKGIVKSRYVNDSAITDHYAIIPTGQGLASLRSVGELGAKIYELICRRFLAIYYPAAIYEKFTIESLIEKEHLFTSFKLCKQPGYRDVMYPSGEALKENKQANEADGQENEDETEGQAGNPEFIAMISSLKKNDKLSVVDFNIKEGETTPPKRYSSGSMILAMENAGQLIEDEELRSQIKSCGIGTSATRAEILKKLVNIKYLELNKKTQIITPTLFGELVYEVVASSIKQLLNPELTASWEKGLNYVAGGSISPDEYMVKLDDFIRRRTDNVLRLNNQYMLKEAYNKTIIYYKKNTKAKNKEIKK